MKFTKVDKEAWVENCVVCHVAMRPVDSQGEIIFGLASSFPCQILHSVRAKENFDTWSKNPVLLGTPIHWFCETCQTVWGVVFGEWTKSTWQGEIEELAPTRISPSGVERVIDYSPPFTGASMCPDCHTWRHIINTEIRGLEEDQVITRTHFCVECKTTQDIVSLSPRELREKFMQNSMSLEGLVGERSPAKLSMQRPTGE